MIRKKFKDLKWGLYRKTSPESKSKILRWTHRPLPPLQMSKGKITGKVGRQSDPVQGSESRGGHWVDVAQKNFWTEYISNITKKTVGCQTFDDLKDNSPILGLKQTEGQVQQEGGGGGSFHLLWDISSYLFSRRRKRCVKRKINSSGFVTRIEFLCLPL